MIELIEIARGICERGMIFGTIVIGVYLSSRLIKFDNLAVEGAFGLGGGLTALLITLGVHPFIVIGATIGIGIISGIATGLLNTKLKLNNLISGIVITAAAFSVTLKIAGSNMPLGNNQTLFTLFSPSMHAYGPFIILTLLSVLLVSGISWFLKTEIGFLLHATGDNPQMLINIGKNTHYYIILGLILSNACAALSGSLFVQYTGYFSIWSSIGILIIGLAGMMLAQALSTDFGFALIIGSIIYQAIISLTFELQLDQDWNRFITALLIVGMILFKQSFQKK